MKNLKPMVMILFLGAIFPAFSFMIISMFVGTVEFPVIQKAVVPESIVSNSIITQPAATFIQQARRSDLSIRPPSVQWIGLKEYQTTGTGVMIVASASAIIHTGKLPEQTKFYTYPLN